MLGLDCHQSSLGLHWQTGWAALGLHVDSMLGGWVDGWVAWYVP